MTCLPYGVFVWYNLRVKKGERMSKPKIILMMGGQGVGKGTMSKMLLDNGNYDYIETGAMLRAAPADSDVAKTIAAGQLVSDEQIFALVLDNMHDGHDVLMDGFPRTLSQAQWLVNTFADKYDIHVIYMTVPTEVMLARINKRINEGAGRKDDADPDAVKRRLDTFFNVTVPAIEWLHTADGVKFAEIDARGTPDAIYTEIVKHI